LKEVTGWLFDLYAHPKQGVVLWIIGEDGRPHSFTQSFQITFYLGGPFHRLRQAWKFLRDKPVRLARTQRDDLHEGTQEVLEVNVFQPCLFDELFKEVYKRFPDLLFYDVELPLILRYAAAYNIFPLGRCTVKVKEAGKSQRWLPWIHPGKLTLTCLIYASCKSGRISIHRMLHQLSYQFISTGSNIGFPWLSLVNFYFP